MIHRITHRVWRDWLRPVVQPYRGAYASVAPSIVQPCLDVYTSLNARPRRYTGRRRDRSRLGTPHGPQHP